MKVVKSLAKWLGLFVFVKLCFSMSKSIEEIIGFLVMFWLIKKVTPFLFSKLPVETQDKIRESLNIRGIFD